MQVFLNICEPLNSSVPMRHWEIKPFLKLSYVRKLEPNVHEKQFGCRANHSCFLVFHILHLRRKWPAGCGIWIREGNWSGEEGSGGETGHHIPHPSHWPWPRVPRPPRQACHQGCSMEATRKLKGSVLKSDPGSATKSVTLDTTRFHSGLPLGNEVLAFPPAVEFCCSSSLGEGRFAAFFFFAIKPTFLSCLCSTSTLAG